MKRTTKILSFATMLFFVAIITTVFYSCKKDSSQNQTKDDNIEMENQSMYFEESSKDENSQFYVDDATRDKIDKLSDINHEKLINEMEITLNEDLNTSNKTDKLTKEAKGCCDLVKVVEQNNPWWVGAEIGDRWWTYTNGQQSSLATFYLNYRGYDHATNQLLQNITIQISSQSCSTNGIWWWWFVVPIPQNVSLHPSCPNPDVRAEFYLYRQFSNIPGPILCDFEWKVFPLRVSNPNHAWCF